MAINIQLYIELSIFSNYIQNQANIMQLNVTIFKQIEFKLNYIYCRRDMAENCRSCVKLQSIKHNDHVG